MPTTLSKTKVRIQRSTTNLTNPAEGINSSVEDIYEGLIFLEDISGNTDFDKYFQTGLQESKRFYIAWDNGKIDIKNNDIICFNLSEIGNPRSFIDENSDDYYTIQLQSAIKQGGLSIMGSRHREGFCISNN